MSFPDECYDPKTLDLMTRALNAAWDEVEFALDDRKALRTVMVLSIIAAVCNGERNPNCGQRVDAARGCKAAVAQ